MSNLSELLPTGGGQNAVDFVASGTLASGQAVVLKADGTVEAVTGATEGVGTPVVFENADSQYCSTVFDSSSNKVVIAYNDAVNSGYGTAIVGTVSGTSISFGTAVVFESALTRNTSSTYDSTNNKVVIAYKDVGGSSYGTAIVGTVSGTSISFGTAVVFNAGTTNYLTATFDSSSNKVVISYQNASNSDHGTAIVGTVSGTSISFGTAVVFESASITISGNTFDSANNKIVISYKDGGNSSYGTAIVGTVSGTSISFGTAVVFNTSVSDEMISTFDSSSNKVVIAYRDGGNSYRGTAIVGTVSGTSISFGSASAAFNSASIYYASATFDSNANKVVLTYRDAGNSDYGTVIVGTVSGTSITFGTPVVFENAYTNFTSSAFDSNLNKIVIGYSDGYGYIGTSVVFTVGSTNNTSFIGITAEAISSAATGPVNVYGGINAVQTGLTIASDYYVQADGSLSTTSTSPAIKVGQAVSATTINMKDLT